ncbi:MAG: GNAT family N-acetyltransferase [Pseudomonadota bacterium]
MIKVSYHDSVKDVQAKLDTKSADDLNARAPFDRLEWYGLLENSGLAPLFACAQQDKTVALLALMQSEGRITPLRNWYASTWRPLAAPGELGDAMIQTIATDLKSRAYRVTLEPVSNEDGCADRIACAFAAAGWRTEVSQCDMNHVIHLKGRDFKEYWAQRPGRLRTTLKRKAKKVTAKISDRFTPELWDNYERIYAASWKPEEDHPEMLRAFAEMEGEANRLRLGLAFLDGLPVAAQFWTVENDCAYIHKLAHLDEHKHLSAGTTLSAAMFEHVIDQDNVASIDFGTGHQPYKSDWMDEIRPRYRIDCLNMIRPAAWYDLAKLSLSRLRDDSVPMLAPRPPAV